MLFIVWERIKWWRSLKTRDIWLLLESRLQTLPNQWAYLFFSINSLLIWTLPLYPGDDCIQEMKHRRNYRGTSSIWFNPFSFISLIPKSSCRPWAWGNIPDGLIPDGITSYLVQSLYIWKQKWAPPSFKSLIRHSDIRIPDQCKPHSSFISSSVHTPIRCCKLSIMLLSTVWSQAQLSIDNIINLDLIHQYRPKSAIGKTPIEKRNRPSTLLQTDNYL